MREDKTKLKGVFDALIDNTRSFQGLKSLAKGFYDTRLVEPSVHLGPGDVRAELREGIDPDNLDGITARESLRISKVDLSEVYRNRQKKQDTIFNLSLVMTGITAAMIILGVLAIFIDKRMAAFGAGLSASALLPGIMVCFAFWFHRSAGKELNTVEQEIVALSRMESLLEMSLRITDEAQRNEAYKYIIRQFENRGNKKRPVSKILVLAANPKTTPQLRLDEEVREIKEGLRRSKNRDQFDLRSEWAVRVRDLRRALLEHEPQILHFSGHGEEDGLLLENNMGFPEPVASNVLSDLFRLFSQQVECVVLSACHSAKQAAAIRKHIRYVIGMRAEIEDRGAIEFSTGFYDALGMGTTIEDAFQLGRNALMGALPDVQAHLIPVLYKKKTLKSK